MAVFANLAPEERVGLGAAVVIHLVLVAALALQIGRDAPLIAPAERIVVSMANDISLESTAPDPSAQPAASFAPTISDVPEPPQEVVERPVTPRVQPTSNPRPTPSPSASRAPTPTPTPSATRSAGGSRLSDNFLDGRSNADGNSGSPAATFGNAEAASLRSAITRQLRRNWSAPQGVDAELLVTTVAWRLNRDGSLAGSPRCVNQSGINDSNRPQAALHCERAMRAVQLGDFSGLPEQFYSRWDDLQWTFDRRL